MGRKRSASSSRWLAEHFKDQFVQKAHKQKLRSRAYFKLDEIQKTDRLFLQAVCFSTQITMLN